MNHYTLLADSRRWWVPPTVAAAAASSAIAVIAVVPLTHSAPAEPPRVPAVHSTVREDQDGAKYRPCFMIRSRWNPVPEGPQPRCRVPGSNAGNDQAFGTTATRHGLRPLEVGV